MEREISSGAMLGIVLLALAAVIGLGFGVFAIAKGIANEGTVNVQDSLGAVSMQVFLDYDQKVITGTQVVSALKSFEGKPYAVLISTKAFMGDQGIASEDDRPDTTGDTNSAYLQQSDSAGGDITYINYNAVIAHAADGSNNARLAAGKKKSAANAVPTTGEIALKNGTFIAPFGFALSDAGSVIYDSNTGGLYKSGNAEYVPTNTKFQANLLKDESGAIMGVVLKQI